MQWIKNPHLARHLARATWPLLVVAYFTVERGSFSAFERTVAIVVLIASAWVLNIPVAYGLRVSYVHRRERAYHVVALGLALRVIATLAVAIVLAR